MKAASRAALMVFALALPFSNTQLRVRALTLSRQGVRRVMARPARATLPSANI